MSLPRIKLKFVLPPFGKTMFGIIAALIQMERNLIIEHTRAGLEAARTRGKKPGVKPIIAGKVKEAVLEWQRRGLTVPQIAEAAHINRTT